VNATKAPRYKDIKILGGSLGIPLCGSPCNFSFTEFHREGTESHRE